MADQNEKAIDVNKLLQNKLKAVSIAELENGIAEKLLTQFSQNLKLIFVEIVNIII